MSDHNHEVLTILQDTLEDQLGETELTEVQGTLFLRLFPALFPDDSGHVYIEICLIPYSDELTVAQIYSTLMPKPGPHTDQLPAHFEDWNLHSAVGAYGLYGENRQLYHKHNIALHSEDVPELQAGIVLAGLQLAMDEMARRLPEAVQIVFDA